MAIEVKIHKDINEYQEKIIMGMSMKQLISVLIAIVVNFLIGFFMIRVLGLEMMVVSWFMIIASIPIVAFGWYKKNGMSFKVYINYFLKYHLGTGKRTRTNKD